MQYSRTSSVFLFGTIGVLAAFCAETARASAAEPGRPPPVTVNGSAKGGPKAGLATTAGQLVIGEFRLRGPNGATDEFVELYNTTGAPLTAQAADASAGLALAASDGVARCIVPNGTVIPAGGHFLCANSVGYSISAYPAGAGTTATANLTYTTDIPDNAGIALFDNSTGGASFSLASRLDAVGSTSEANAVYKEGTAYPALTPFSINYSFTRKINLVTGLPIDTGNNSTDLLFVDTNGTSAGAGQRLGAPGPENLSSPVNASGCVTVALLDGAAVTAAAPNYVRDLTSDPGNNSTFGTVRFRRKVTNNCAASIDRLRFVIVDISTFPSPSGTMDLRHRTSVLEPAVATSGGPVAVQALTVEQPPSQPNGGAFNSTWSAGTVTTATPLAVGASVNVGFLVGVQQAGTGRVLVNVEATPGVGTPGAPTVLGDGSEGMPVSLQTFSVD